MIHTTLLQRRSLSLEWNWVVVSNVSFSRLFGCFRKWGYPQIIHFNRVFHYKPSILGYPIFGNTHLGKIPLLTNFSNGLKPPSRKMWGPTLGRVRSLFPKDSPVYKPYTAGTVQTWYSRRATHLFRLISTLGFTKSREVSGVWFGSQMYMDIILEE